MSVHSGSNLEFGSVGFSGEGKTGIPGENLSEQGENQQQNQPIYGAGTGNRTRDTLVSGERSHHCATPALTSIYNTYASYIRMLTQHGTIHSYVYNIIPNQHLRDNQLTDITYNT